MMTNWRVKIGAVLLLMACTSCDAPTNLAKTPRSPDVTTKESDGETSYSTYTTESGKSFIVTAEPYSASLAVVSLKTDGFDFDTVHQFGALDPIEAVFLTDLDQNGFQELYLITQSVGSGSHQSIFGVASNRDRSSSPVYVPELEQGELRDGFMGHNRFSLDEDGLIETYPMYKPGDTNVQPSGGERRIRYSLIPGETGWLLKPTVIDGITLKK